MFGRKPHYLAKAALNTLWAGLEWCFKTIPEQRGNSVKTFGK